MLTFDYNDTFDSPAAAVFALLIDLEARPNWIKGILETRVAPQGPARLGTSYFESGKYSGFKSEKTMTVTEWEQDRLLTLDTPAEAPQSFRESYRIEPLSTGTCRVDVTLEVGAPSEYDSPARNSGAHPARSAARTRRRQRGRRRAVAESLGDRAARRGRTH